MPAPASTHAILTGTSVGLVLDWTTGHPEIAHVGAPLDRWNPDARRRPVPLASLNECPVAGIVLEESTGFAGRPGLSGSRPDGTGWSPRLRLVGEPAIGATSAAFELNDPVAELGATVSIEIEPSDAIVIELSLTNSGSVPYSLTRLAPSLPLAAQLSELLTLTGRWGAEFATRRSTLTDTHVIDNRRGRTSHDRPPAMFIGTEGFGEQTGEVLGVQLAWSGNHELIAERRNDGRGHIQAGELLFTGEVELAPGATHSAPRVVAAWSDQGLNAVSRVFHRHVRAHAPGTGRPRPVTLNTWEAVYFGHDLDTISRLARSGAELGVERFVLDDGWFGSRRDDTSGLGDWWVSEDVWPDGLEPLAELVESLGMEFGLWFEPEMVNPDSELYRAHPEWALTSDGYEPPLARNQLVLDLGRPEVRDHLFGAIDTLLARLPVAYVKWDMNRDLVQASGASGRAGSRAQTLGFYDLLDRLRATHPGVEFESCSSGGGRTDLEVLRRTDRIWTSDCNDALARQSIQRGFSLLFPPEVMGAHIGPDRAHLTLRRHDLGFRGATAMFGHLGIEWNVLEASDLERLQLTRLIAAHQRLRPLLHRGDVIRGDHPDESALVHGVVSSDRTHGLFSYVQLTPSVHSVPHPFRLDGLSPDADYLVEVLDLGTWIPGGHGGVGWTDSPITLSGRQLASSGLQPPVMFSEGALLLEVTAVE